MNGEAFLVALPQERIRIRVSEFLLSSVHSPAFANSLCLRLGSFHWVLPLERLDPLVYRLAIYSWDPGKMGRFFHYSGNLLEGIGATERVVAESVHRPNTSMTIRINQEMRNSGGFIYNWRKVLNHFGMSKPAINKIIEAQVSKVSANWTKEIMATMTSFKAG